MAASAQHASWRTELRELVSLALPAIVMSGSMMAMTVTDQVRL